MKIKLGGTRIVLLVGGNAIKVGKIRLLHFSWQSARFFFSKIARTELATRHKHAPLSAVRNSIFSGIMANRNEYQYWTSTKDRRVMPVPRQILGGLVIVQRRGTPVLSTELERDCLFYSSASTDHDTARICQFCHHPDDRRIVLVDFGWKSTTEFLMSTLSI